MNAERRRSFVVNVLVLAALLVLAGCGPSPKQALPPPDQRVKLLGIPDEYRGLRNPLPATPANLETGKKRFAAHCTNCHATNGSGNTQLARGMYPRPRPLGSAPVQAQSDGELFWIVSQGIRYSGMPAGHQQHSEEQMWQMVLYLRTLPSPPQGARDIKDNKDLKDSKNGH